MRKLFLIIILIIIPVFFTNTYAADTIIVKIPINLHSVIDGCNETSSNWAYECKIETWFASVWKWIWQIIKYFTFITGLAWVLYIIFNWIKLSMAWMNQSLKESAIKSIQKTLIWLVLLLLSWVLLNFIAPWIYT